jgi:hypothetical protein
MIVLSLTACSAQEEGAEAAGSWVGTITTEGNVTTVVNESGSVWGGAARLVEEASIGVDAGEDAYMLGRVLGVVASADRIYVLDSQIPTVRAYDLAGSHVMDIGGPGGGPGEFDGPDYLSIGPDGAIYVRTGVQGRLTIFEPDGRLRDTWRYEGPTMSGRPTLVTDAGAVYLPGYVSADGDPATRRSALIRAGADGADSADGETIMEPESEGPAGQLVAQGDGPTLRMPVPFAPQMEWAVATSGAIIAGTSDDYSFEIRRPGGAMTRVRKGWEPVAVAADEIEWERQQVFEVMRRFYPDWAWAGPEVPTTKPAFVELQVDRDGRVWVYRGGPSAYNPACDDPEPPRGTDCWIAETIVDVFDPDGRYLGVVDMPAALGRFPPPFIRGDMVVGVVEDEVGTIMVKRYRLVLPEEE